MTNGVQVDEWVMLSYRMPRDPSTPRIALWRRLRRLGVAQVVDGLVALPADARTREQLEWAAEQVVESGGDAGVWVARPTTHASARSLAAAMRRARAEEYGSLAAAAAAALDAAPAERRRALERLRRTRREIGRRDFFPPPERDDAARSLRALEDACRDDPAGATPAATHRTAPEGAR